MMIRGLFVISILIWVAALVELQPMFLLLLYSLIILYMQGVSFSILLQSFRLLLWLFIPTLLFHGLFTPGALIQTPVYLPLSYEGLQRGLFLCVHIALIFFVAMLVFRMFTLQEWLSSFDKLPKANYLKPYIFLLSRLRHRAAEELAKRQQVWRQQGKQWSKLPDILVLSIQDMLMAAKIEAGLLWHNWDTQLTKMRVQPSQALPIKDGLYLSALVLGWVMMWLV